MDDLIGRLVADTGVHRATAEQAAGAVLRIQIDREPIGLVRARAARAVAATMRIAAVPNGSGRAKGCMGTGRRIAATECSCARCMRLAVRAATRRMHAAAVGGAVGGIVDAAPGSGRTV
jgi:hypothetical protein